MNYQESLNYINSLLVFGSKLGLERITALLNRLGNPQDNLNVIHVAGTNGKGSVTTMCSNALIDAGYRVGTYISPYVNDFRERIQLNGEMIEKEKLAGVVSRVKEVLNGEEITEFEFITACAFLYFFEEKCDYVCLEVGLGGRYDATNVIKKPLVSVITAIDLDHTAILGDSVEKIAQEKCGIIKKDCPVVCYPKQPSGVLGTVIENAALNSSALHIPAPPHHSEIFEDTAYSTKFQFSGHSFNLSMHGTHQLLNAITAAQALMAIDKSGEKIPRSAIESGISRAVLPARIQTVNENPLVVIDGSHNPSGVEMLADVVKQIKADKKILVMGMLKDKDVKTAVSQIAPLCDVAVATEPKNERKMSAEELSQILGDYTKVFTEQVISNAAKKAVSLADKGDAIIVCGSLYMAGEMKDEIKAALENV